MDSKVQVVSHPPRFKGEKSKLWKLKIINFLKYYNIDILEFIEIGIPIYLVSLVRCYQEILGLKNRNTNIS